jgi:hypothetical protein
LCPKDKHNIITLLIGLKLSCVSTKHYLDIDISMTDNKSNLQPTDKSSSASKTPLQSLLHEPVTRSQFLTIVGFGVLSVFGFSKIVHFFTGKSGNHTISSTTNTHIAEYGHRSGKK